MKRQIEEHVQLAAALAGVVPLLERIADAVLACFARGGRVYLIGNGGSAADAQHIAAELLGRFKINRAPLPAVALTTDTSTLTAVGNDLGAEQIFARQVEALVTERDILWVLSVSGASPNILTAVEIAAQRGAEIIGFTSRRGQRLAEFCKHCLQVQHDDSDRVQEIHELAYHLICERIEARAAQGVHAAPEKRP
jgi:D-sedoheptulose 7-phosphate isomerase